MQAPLSEKEIRTLLEKLKQDLSQFPEGSGYMDLGLESAAKHIPTYLKIVKGHIDQLANVLKLETHDQRKLENVELAEPVTQLMQLFRNLDEHDIQLLETLAYEAYHWRTETTALHSKEMVNEGIPTEA